MEKTLVITTLLSVLLCTPAFADAPTANGADKSNSSAQAVEVKAASKTVPGATSSFTSTETGSGEPSVGTPIERAKGEKLATAMGHYARSRSLLVAAIREFDKGFALVDPNALLDSRMFRDSLLDRAQELERLLDPQPRATKGGVKFGSETRGIGDTSK